MSDWPAAAAAPATEMQLIATTTLGAPAAAVTFSGIDTGYRIFEAAGWILKDANAGNVGITLNNDGGANYAYQRASASGLVVSGSRVTGATKVVLDTVGTLDANTVASFVATVAKPIAGVRGNLVAAATFITGAAIVLEQVAGEWANTADLISRIDVTSVTNNLATGTRVSLGGAKTA